MPAVAPAEDPDAPQASMRGGNRPPFLKRMTMQQRFGAAPFSGADRGEVGGWLGIREERPIDALAVAVLADAWFPAPWPRLTALAPAPTIDLTDPLPLAAARGCAGCCSGASPILRARRLLRRGRRALGARRDPGRSVPPARPAARREGPAGLGGAGGADQAVSTQAVAQKADSRRVSREHRRQRVVLETGRTGSRARSFCPPRGCAPGSRTCSTARASASSPWSTRASPRTTAARRLERPFVAVARSSPGRLRGRPAVGRRSSDPTRATTGSVERGIRRASAQQRELARPCGPAPPPRGRPRRTDRRARPVPAIHASASISASSWPGPQPA